jgi:hypothetical protein
MSCTHHCAASSAAQVSAARHGLIRNFWFRALVRTMSAGLEKSFENMTKYDDDAQDAAEDNRVIILIVELLLGMGCITMFVKHRRKAQSRLIFEDVPLCVAACIASVQYRRTACQSSLIGLCSPYAPDCFFHYVDSSFLLPCPSARSSLVLNFVNTLVLREYCARRGAQDSTQFAIQVSASKKLCTHAIMPSDLKLAHHPTRRWHRSARSCSRSSTGLALCFTGRL